MKSHYNYRWAKPTYHRGREYRSKLEAAWGVFFDSMGVKAVYEDKAYMIRGYLPDFHVRDWYGKGIFEVKPIDGITEEALHKANDCYSQIGRPITFLNGRPDFRFYPRKSSLYTCRTCGLMDLDPNCFICGDLSYRSSEWHEAAFYGTEYYAAGNLYKNDKTIFDNLKLLDKSLFSDRYIKAVEASDNFLRGVNPNNDFK